MRCRLRQVAICLMRWLGVIRLFQFIHRNHLIILTVHGVMDERDEPLWKPLRRQLSREKLDEYLKVLSRRYHFVSLAEVAQMIEGTAPIRPYSMAITFDDGYRNNITQ